MTQPVGRIAPDSATEMFCEVTCETNRHIEPVKTLPLLEMPKATPSAMGCVLLFIATLHGL